MQLGRPVRRADDQRNPGVMCLDHSGMQFGRGGAARDADDGRPPGRHGEPQGEEGRTAFVETDVGPESLGQGQRQGGRPRAGTDHRVGDPESGPLVDQGGAERGLYAHPSCHSMSRCAVRGRRWWCCTDSRRRVGSGVASESTWPNRTRWWRWTFPGHGGSDSVRADLPTTADLVAEAVRAILGDEPCDLLGYSLGARVALHVVTRNGICLCAMRSSSASPPASRTPADA